VFALDKPPKGWTGETGYVNAEVVKKALSKFGTTSDKGEKVKVFVCELPITDSCESTERGKLIEMGVDRWTSWSSKGYLGS